jgi:Ser/Thr protein kinase RdoA (MazF antagonist)
MFHGNFQTRRFCYRLFPDMIGADAMLADAITLLTTNRPALSETQAAALLREHYGLEGELEPQDSERDQNFLLRSTSGRNCVLKIASAAEAATITDFQIAALLHLENSPVASLVPNVIRTHDGDTRLRVPADDGRFHTVRVLSWLPGVMRRPDEVNQIALYPMGETLASLDKALRDFEHPASDYPLLWDIKQAQRLQDLLHTVTDAALRDVLRKHIETFVTEVKPRLPELRWQIIHNDLNPGNVLFDSRDDRKIAGIIDFGDMIRSPLVIDAAVACAYLCRRDDGSLADLLEFLRGYDAVTPLTDDELELLPYLVTIRNVTTVVISHWRASMYPENQAYILRSADQALHMLNTFGRRSPTAVTREMQEHCGHHD